MNVAAAFVVRLQGRHRPAYAFPKRAAFDCIAFGILVVAAIGLFSAAAAPAYPLTGPPFFVLTVSIIAGAFILIAWYGWQLRAVDWPVDSIV